MGSGCLSPPQSVSQLDITLLQQIFQQPPPSPSSAYPPSSNKYLSSPQQQFHSQLLQSLSKKGQIKKLCDYLSTHRWRIYDVVLHCYRIVGQSQSKGGQGGNGRNVRYIAIIVLDGIIGSIPKNVGIKNSGLGDKENNQSSAYTIVSAERELIQKNQSTGNITIRTSPPMQPHLSPSSHSMSNSPYPQLTSPKFLSIYLSLLHTLHKQNSFMYKKCLENLTKYCSLLPSSFQFTGSNILSVLQQFFNSMYYHIEIEEETLVSLRCYWEVGERVRELGNFQGFLELWTQGRRQVGKIRKNGGKIEKELAEKQILLRKILLMIIISAINGYNRQKIIADLFNFMDRREWEGIREIQELIFDRNEQRQEYQQKQEGQGEEKLLMEQDVKKKLMDLELKHQFDKSLYLYLLAYVAYPGNLDQGSFLRILSRNGLQSALSSPQSINPILKHWQQLYPHQPSLFPKKYKKILSQKNKLLALPLISRWLFDYKIVQISQLFNYSCLQIIYAFGMNLYQFQGHQGKEGWEGKGNGWGSVGDKAIGEFKKFMRKIGGRDLKESKVGKIDNSSLVFYVVNQILRQIQECTIIDDQVRETLLQVCESVIEGYKILPLTSNELPSSSFTSFPNQHFIQIPTTCYNFGCNIKIIKLSNKIISKLTFPSLEKYVFRICQYFNAVFVEVVYGFSGIQQKICVIQQFGQQDQVNKGMEGIYRAFLGKLERQSAQDDHNKNAIPQNSFLFVDYLYMKIANNLNLGIRNPNLESYLQKLSQSPQLAKFNLLSSYSSDRLPIPSSSLLSPSSPSSFPLFTQSSDYFLSSHKSKNENDLQNFNDGLSLWKPSQSVIKMGSKDSICSYNQSHQSYDGSQGEIQLGDVIGIIRG